MREGHLSAGQVLAILDIVQEHDAILIGGQSVNLWSEFYVDVDPRLAAWRPYTSKDIDFYRNTAAAERLNAVLGGRLRVPVSIDDATPNAATVVGTLDGNRVEIDFLGRVLGVDDQSIERNYVTLEGFEQSTRRSVRILILHPLDCFRSRLSNLNDLKRCDTIAIGQAQASVVVLQCFIADLLRHDAWRDAQRTLLDLSFVIRDRHVGRLSHLQHDIRPETVLRHFVHHDGLDPRWRALRLEPMVRRLESKLAAALKRNERRPSGDGAH